MKALSQMPGCKNHHRSSARLCLLGHVAYVPAHVLARHKVGTPLEFRSVHARGIFDGGLLGGIRNLILSSDAIKAQQPEESGGSDDNEEEDAGAEMMRLDSKSGGLAEDQSVFGPLVSQGVSYNATTDF